MRGQVDLPENEQKVYDYYCLCSWRECPVDIFDDWALPWDKELRCSTYLRSFNIFATLLAPDKIKLITPAFVTSLVHQRKLSFLNTYHFQYGDRSVLFEFAIPNLAMVWQSFQVWSEDQLLFPYLIFFHLLRKLLMGPVINKNGRITEKESEDIVASQGEKEIATRTKGKHEAYLIPLCHTFMIN